MSDREFADAFGSQVTKGTTNKADIAGHYPYSPERFRFFVNGNRQFIQYNSVSQYNDIVDGHELSPAQGETATLTTTERFRYVVGYVSEPSMALQFSRSLESGDKAVIGYGDPDLNNDMASADGWFFIYTPDLADDEVTVAEYRNGTELDSETVSLEKSLTIWKRLAIRFNWYNVGEAKYIETYTENGDQINAEQGKTSVDNGKGPEVGNHPVTFSVQRGASSSALTLESGSVGVQVLGDVEGLVRPKVARFVSDIGTADTFVPVGAIRVDPNREIVNAQIDVLQPVDFSSDTDIELIGVAVDPSKTDASGFDTPAEHNETNSVIEQTTTITEFPDSTGSVVTSASDPGGYQIGYGSRYTSGQGSGSKERSSSRTQKRQLSDRDIIVILARADDTLTSLTVEYRTGQDW